MLSSASLARPSTAPAARRPVAALTSDEVARTTDQIVATLPDLDVSHPLPEPLVRARRTLVGGPRAGLYAYLFGQAAGMVVRDVELTVDSVLPGIVLVFPLTGSRATMPTILGATLVGSDGPRWSASCCWRRGAACSGAWGGVRWTRQGSNDPGRGGSCLPGQRVLPCTTMCGLSGAQIRERSPGRFTARWYDV